MALPPKPRFLAPPEAVGDDEAESGQDRQRPIEPESHPDPSFQHPLPTGTVSDSADSNPALTCVKNTLPVDRLHRSAEGFCSERGLIFGYILGGTPGQAGMSSLGAVKANDYD